MRTAVRAVIFGALVGAFVGFIAGLVLHAAFGSGGPLVGYEIIPALLGVLFGAIAGAFYGGALTFGRKDQSG